MLVTVGTDVALHPTASARVYTAVLDWGMVYSFDGGATVAQSKPLGGGTDGLAVAVDPGTGKVYLSLEGANGGEIFSSSNPAVKGSWRSEKLSRAPGEGGAPAAAIAVNRPGRNAILVAAVTGSGVWAKVLKDGGTWIRTLDRSSFGPNLRISWVGGSRIVYVYDPATGEVWMSQDAGGTWGASPIWSQPSPTKVSGFIAADTLDPTTLYVSTDTGLYALANTTGELTVNQITSVPDPTPGPVTVDATGRLWVAGRASGSEGAGLWFSRDGGSAWTNVADDYYENTAPFPWQLAVNQNGAQYLALRGNGLISSAPVP
jgi:hypothetical protein